MELICAKLRALFDLINWFMCWVRVGFIYFGSFPYQLAWPKLVAKLSINSTQLQLKLRLMLALIPIFSATHPPGHPSTRTTTWKSSLSQIFHWFYGISRLNKLVVTNISSCLAYWLGVKQKNSAKRDTRPLKGRDLNHKCSLGGIPKDHLVEKKWSV